MLNYAHTIHAHSIMINNVPHFICNSTVYIVTSSLSHFIENNIKSEYNLTWSVGHGIRHTRGREI